MKSKFRLFFMLFICMLGMYSLSSCSEDWDEAQLAVDNTKLNVGAAGGALTISIRINTDWKVVTGNHSWLSFDRTSGSGDSELKITVEQNSSARRVGKFIIYAGAEYVEIEVEQCELRVTTGDCKITRKYNSSTKMHEYTIKVYYTVLDSYLASEYGVLINNTKYKSTGDSSGGKWYIQTTESSTSSTYTVTYQAYAVNKTTGETVYGASETQTYKRN